MATIFDSIVRRENDYTQLLTNLLERSPLLASRVMTFMLGREFDRMEAARLRSHTQFVFRSESGREIPDLVLESDHFRCLLEIKVDPDLGLTDAQLHGYAGCFRSAGEEHLVFLVPDSWKHRSDVELLRAKSSGTFVVQPVRTWGDLIRKICEIRKLISDPLVTEAVDFLIISFEVVRMKSSEKAALQEWNSSAYSALRKLEMTIDQTKKLLAAQGFEVEAETSDPTGYGFYVKEGATYRVWVGIWDAAPFPLMFGFNTAGRGWRVPDKLPAGSVPDKAKGTHRLWQVPEEAWDSPNLVLEQVRQFLVDTSEGV